MSQAATIPVGAPQRVADADDLAGSADAAPNLPAGLPRELRNYWYPVLQSEELEAGKAIGFTVLGENLVAWRGRDGAPCVAP